MTTIVNPLADKGKKVFGLDCEMVRGTGLRVYCMDICMYAYALLFVFMSIIYVSSNV